MTQSPHSHRRGPHPCISEPPSLQRWDLGTSYRTTGGLVHRSMWPHLLHTVINRTVSNRIISNSFRLNHTWVRDGPWKKSPHICPSKGHDRELWWLCRLWDIAHFTSVPQHPSPVPQHPSPVPQHPSPVPQHPSPTHNNYYCFVIIKYNHTLLPLLWVQWASRQWNSFSVTFLHV